MDSLNHQRSNKGMMDDEKMVIIDDHSENDDAISCSSKVSSLMMSSEEDSDMFEEVDSSATFSTSSSTNSSSAQLESEDSGPLQDMASLLRELPIKRGLSKHYDGKSQSFASLANVKNLEDLAKPENPYIKRLKTCNNYGRFLGVRRNQSHNTYSSRKMSKKSSRTSFSSLSVRRNASFTAGNRPPIPPPPPPPPPPQSTNTSNFTTPQITPLFTLGI